jgi:hypothetical protein
MSPFMPKAMERGWLGGGAHWKDVTQPGGFTLSLPFTIEQLGNSFRPKSGWDVSSLAPSGKAYYVDPINGSDGYAGDSFAAGHPFATVFYAMGKADAVEIHLAPGLYGYEGTLSGAWHSSIGSLHGTKIICDGGIATLTARLFLSYTPVLAHYSATTTRAILGVMDSLNVNADGSATKYALVANEAAVESTPGSYYKGGSNDFYVHCSDGRAPDANLHVCLSAAPNPLLITKDNATYYFENIAFAYGNSVSLGNSTSAGGLNIYFKNCSFKNIFGSSADVFSVTGANIILQGCAAMYAAKDAFNYHVGHTVAPTAIEINCEAGYCGTAGDTSDQGSTIHDAGKILRLMSKYHDTYGQGVGDVGGSLSWNLGCESYNALGTARWGFRVDATASIMWLDSCYSHNNADYDLYISAGCTAYTRNFRSGGAFSGAPTPY